MDKFVLRKNADKGADQQCLMVKKGAYDTLRKIKEETGIPMVDIADARIKFCADRLKIVDED